MEILTQLSIAWDPSPGIHRLGSFNREDISYDYPSLVDRLQCADS